jgi:hypothetical protein
MSWTRGLVELPEVLPAVSGVRVVAVVAVVAVIAVIAVVCLALGAKAASRALSSIEEGDKETADVDKVNLPERYYLRTAGDKAPIGWEAEAVQRD